MNNQCCEQGCCTYSQYCTDNVDNICYPGENEYNYDVYMPGDIITDKIMETEKFKVLYGNILKNINNVKNNSNKILNELKRKDIDDNPKEVKKLKV